MIRTSLDLKKEVWDEVQATEVKHQMFFKTVTMFVYYLIPKAKFICIKSLINYGLK